MDDVLSSFLVKLTFDQDERSRKKIDAGLKSIQDHAQEFGKKIGELPTIVHEATKKISTSLTSLYYTAQQTRATEQQLHAFIAAAMSIRLMLLISLLLKILICMEMALQSYGNPALIG